jgi:aspartyl-tRNA synthetase
MFEKRNYCGELSASHIGKNVLLAGWVDVKRDLGGIIFIEMRDVTGIVQVVVDSSQSPENALIAEKLRGEYCILVEGQVRKRTDETVNPALTTGDIEVVVERIAILNASLVPPFPIDSRDPVSEEMRLRYRFLDPVNILPKIDFLKLKRPYSTSQRLRGLVIILSRAD